MLPLHKFLLILALLHAWNASAQTACSAWAVEPTVGIGVSTLMARVEQEDLPNTSVRLSGGLAVQAGLRIRMPGRLGLDLRGEYDMQGYHLRPGGDRYMLYHNVPRLELQPTYYFPWSERQEMQFSIGMAVGIGYPGTIGPANIGDAYTTTATIASEKRTYLGLELSTTWLGPGSSNLSFAVRYQADLDRGPAWTSTATSAEGQATFSATNNCLRLVFRMHFRTRQHAVQGQPERAHPPCHFRPPARPRKGSP